MLLKSWKEPKGSSVTLCFKHPEMDTGMVRVTCPVAYSFPGLKPRTKTQGLCRLVPLYSFVSATGIFAHLIFLLIPSPSLSAYLNLILQDFGQAPLITL